MSKIADALKQVSQEQDNAISPVKERKGLMTNFKGGGNMRKTWLTWVFIVVVVTIFAVFNYQEGKDAVPLSEIFPDEKVVPVDVAYEFAEDETTPTAVQETLPVAQEVTLAPAPVLKPVETVVTTASTSLAKTGNYTVQIASFKDKKRAEDALANIRGKVPSAYMASRDLGEKGIWYRIYAGQFERRSEAEVTLNDIKKDFNSSFIISSKSAQ